MSTQPQHMYEAFLHVFRQEVGSSYFELYPETPDNFPAHLKVDFRLRKQLRTVHQHMVKIHTEQAEHMHSEIGRLVARVPVVTSYALANRAVNRYFQMQNWAYDMGDEYQGDRFHDAVQLSEVCAMAYDYTKLSHGYEDIAWWFMGAIHRIDPDRAKALLCDLEKIR